MVQKPRRVYLDLEDLWLKDPGAGRGGGGGQLSSDPRLNQRLSWRHWLLSEARQPDTDCPYHWGLRLHLVPQASPSEPAPCLPAQVRCELLAR